MRRGHLIAWKEQHAPEQTVDEWHQQLAFGEVPEALKYLLWRTDTAIHVRSPQAYILLYAQTSVASYRACSESFNKLVLCSSTGRLG
jgi:hypothetical protein